MSRHLSFLAASLASLSLLITPAAQGETYTQAASSLNHTCAIYGSGGLHCWGDNSSGQLGDGTTTNSAIPVVVSGLTGVTSVSAGGTHTCALTQGVVKCWGGGSEGQLGNGTTNSSPTPVLVIGLSTVVNQVVALAVGEDFSCAHMQNIVSGVNTARCWGGNFYGQIGSGTSVARVLAPASVSGLTGVSHLTAGSIFACAVTGGLVRCWGGGFGGVFGNGSVANSNVPAAAATGITNATMVTAGLQHVCAANGTTGDAWCWGDRADGQVGDGTQVLNSPILTPRYFGLGFRPTKIFAGFSSNCAIASGQAFCWGNNSHGQAGNVGVGISAYVASPVAVTGQSGGVAAMAAGRYHACAITTAGALSCWGGNTLGQRGSAPFGAGNPLAAPVGVVKCSLDLDGDGQVLATTDAVLMARAALGYSGAALTSNAFSAIAPRRTSADVLSYLSASCGITP